MELVTVVAIIGLLATVILVNVNRARQITDRGKAASDLKNIELALVNYLADNGELPCFDHDFDSDTERDWSAPYISWPEVPWGGNYLLEHGFYGQNYTISIEFPDQAYMLAFDEVVDDGVINTGNFRGQFYAGFMWRGEYLGLVQEPYNHVHDSGGTCP